jgi:hypothetical protein
LPAVELSQKEIWVRVSVVPPLVQLGLVPVIVIDPPEAADQVMAGRVVEPTAAAEPPVVGSPVWSFTYTLAIPVKVVPRNTSSHLLAS